MISLETQYFSTLKIVSIIFGLWPIQQSTLDRVRFYFLFSIIVTAILFQFTSIITTTCTLDVFIKDLSSVLLFSMYTIMYSSFYIHIKTVKNIFIQLQQTCNELKNENEITIMKRYGHDSKRVTTALLSMIVIFSICATVVAQFWPKNFHVILPINESQSPSQLQIAEEYFLDEEKYYYLILFHAAFFIGLMSVMPSGVMLLAYLYHICAMFKIASFTQKQREDIRQDIFTYSYRIKNAVKIYELQNMRPENGKVTMQKIICAVNIHRQAMALCKYMMSRFEIMFLILTLIIVLTVSINLFQCFYNVVSRNIKELILPFTVINVCVASMFVAHFAGQAVTDHTDDIYSNAYSTEWYIAPVYVQKLILFLLQKRTKTFTLSIGGLFDASLETFAMLIKISISYFTVLYSIQQ